MDTSYREGDVFAIPLPSGGYARVVIAHANGRGIALGYFFGPRMQDLNSHAAAPVEGVEPTLIRRFGDLGIISGRWSSLGRVTNFLRHDYPVPVFYREVLLTPVVTQVTYDEETLEPIREERASARPNDSGEPKDGLMGAEFAENLLDQIL